MRVIRRPFPALLMLLLLAGCGEGPAPDLPNDWDNGFGDEPMNLMPLDEGNAWYYQHTVDPEGMDTVEVIQATYIRGEEFMEVLSFDINWPGGSFHGSSSHFWRTTDSSVVKLDRGLGVGGLIELEYRFPELASEARWPIPDLSGGPYQYYTEVYHADTTMATPVGTLDVLIYRSYRENANLDGEIDAYWMDYFAEDIGWIGREYVNEEGHSAWLKGYDLRE